MKKIQYLLTCLLLLFSCTIFAETRVQPFIDCKIMRSTEGWQYRLNYSPGFPIQESKLFVILHYGDTVKKAEIPLQKTIAFDWKYTPGKRAFCSSHIKWEFPEVEGVSIKNELMPSEILFPGRKVVLMTWKTTSLADGKTLEQFCGKMALELQVPEHILKKYAGCMSYEDLLMENFLKKIHTPDYWQHAKEFPAIPKKSKSKYLTYPEVIRANIIGLDKEQRAFDAGELTLLPILEHEILIIKTMLYAKDLPETMRKNLVREGYQRYKKIVSLKENAFAAGAETKAVVDLARLKLKSFMIQHNIKE